MNLDKIYVFIKRVLGRLIYLRYRICPLEEKVVCSNFSGKRYGDSPKYIAEELHRQNPQIPIIWLWREGYDFEVPDYVKRVKWRSVRMFRELCTARVWVNSHTWPVYVHKRKGQFYLETWHGGIPLKKVEGDAADKLDYAYISNYRHNARIADVFLSGSEWTTALYRRAMGFQGKVAQWGIPRNDLLFRDPVTIRQKIRTAFHLDTDRKILLYAPTFRNEMDGGWLDLDFDRLQKELGKNWAVFVRLHPVMIHLNREFFGAQEHIVDVSLYPDIQELILASDMLVTDYSSLMFDFAMIKKPVLIYATDVGEYVNERGFYFDIYQLPFPFAAATEQLIHNIKQFDQAEYDSRVEEFFHTLGMKESTYATKLSVWLIRAYLEKYKIEVIEEMYLEMEQRKKDLEKEPLSEKWGGVFRKKNYPLTGCAVFSQRKAA